MNDVQLCITEMQTFFRNGSTQSVAWRKIQLKRLKEGIKEHEREILDALFEDLGKTDFEGYATELGLVYAEIDEHLKHLDAWTSKKRVRNTLLSFPSKSYTISIPL